MASVLAMLGEAGPVGKISFALEALTDVLMLLAVKFIDIRIVEKITHSRHLTGPGVLVIGSFGLVRWVAHLLV